jgi:hypothetical protein
MDETSTVLFQPELKIWMRTKFLSQILKKKSKLT